MVTTKTTSKKKTKPKITKYMRSLKCDLSEEEQASAAVLLAQKLDEMDALEGELVSVKKSIQGKVALAQAEASNAKNMVRDKYEVRSVEVKETMDYEDKSVTIVRLDTGEVIESRKMSETELQMELGY